MPHFCRCSGSGRAWDLNRILHVRSILRLLHTTISRNPLLVAGKGSSWHGFRLRLVGLDPLTSYTAFAGLILQPTISPTTPTHNKSQSNKTVWQHHHHHARTSQAVKFSPGTVSPSALPYPALACPALPFQHPLPLLPSPPFHLPSPSPSYPPLDLITNNPPAHPSQPAYPPTQQAHTKP